MPRNYSFIYVRLVVDEADFVGQIAYAIYKQDKINFITGYIEERGEEIPEDELDKFHQMSCKEIVIEAYRIRAEEILEEFINDTLKQAIRGIEEKTIEKQLDILREIIKPITPASGVKQFWTRVLQSVMANLTLSTILALIILVLYVARVGFLKTIENIYDVKFTPDTDRH